MIQVWDVTDIGLVRKENQDAYQIRESGDYTICVVCDGMGGAAGGRLASQIATETFTSELERLLAECPALEEPGGGEPEAARALEDIDGKIDRLMAALAESSELTMPYINRTVARLEARRRELLERQARLRGRPRPARRLEFSPLTFAQKKLVAARFIREIRLSGDRAEVIWNV